MRHQKSLFGVVALLLALAALSVGQEAQYKELPNFHQVNSNLYRGGQPRKDGLQQLKQLGIKTIINLRDNDARTRSEEAEARALGLSYFNIPFDTFNRPSDKAVDDVLTLINTADNQPVFVHCNRGADRTGTIIAIYRIENDGWTSEKAKAEARHFGMGFWEIEMKNYIRDYYQRRTQRNDNSTSASQKP